MKTAKRIALYVCVVLMVAIWATIVDGVAVLGSQVYLVYYPAARLCNSLQPGMELRDVEARIYQIGKPDSITYSNGQLVIFSMDSVCSLDIDPTTKRVAKVSISASPAYL
jgi:hypothetical protein